MHKVVIQGYYGANNIGDEAILAAVIQGLRERVDSLNVTVLSLDPGSTLRDHAVDEAVYAPPLPWNNLGHSRWALLRAISGADLFILGGGGLFHDFGGTVRHWLDSLFFAKFLGAKVMVYALGVDPSFRARSRWATLWRHLAPLVDVISVRDEGSRDILLQIRSRDRVLVVPDPVFGLAPSALRTPQLIAVGEYPRSQPLVGFVPGLPRRLLPGTLSEYCALMAGVADATIAELGARVVLIPFDTLPGRDREMCLEILARMECRGQATVLLNRYTPGEILAFTQRLDLAVCTRLHAHVFAIRTGTPFASIAYMPKVQRLMEALDLSAYSIAIGGVTQGALLSRIQIAWTDRDRLAAELLEKAAALFAGSQVTSDIAAELIVGSSRSGAAEASVV